MNHIPNIMKQALFLRPISTACPKPHWPRSSHLHAARDSTSEEGGGTFCLHHLHPQRHENQEILNDFQWKEWEVPTCPGGKFLFPWRKNPGRKTGCWKAGIIPLRDEKPPKTRWQILPGVFRKLWDQDLPPKSYGTGMNWEDASFASLKRTQCPLGV